MFVKTIVRPIHMLYRNACIATLVIASQECFHQTETGVPHALSLLASANANANRESPFKDLDRRVILFKDCTGHGGSDK